MNYLSVSQVAKEWKNEKGCLIDTCLSAQDKFKEMLKYFRIDYV